MSRTKGAKDKHPRKHREDIRLKLGNLNIVITDQPIKEPLRRKNTQRIRIGEGKIAMMLTNETKKG